MQQENHTANSHYMTRSLQLPTIVFQQLVRHVCSRFDTNTNA
uniref:Uncharacterized protein n=1 Tax=Rhizophora mucronata TaxID=61149 RepID=A0A2P2QAT6_RHIMU